MLEALSREEVLANHRRIAEELQREVLRVVGPDLGRFVKVHEMTIPDPDTLNSTRKRFFISSNVSLGAVGTQRIEQRTWDRMASLIESFESKHHAVPLAARLIAAKSNLSERDVTQGVIKFQPVVTDTTPGGGFSPVYRYELALRLLEQQPNEHIRVRPGTPVWVIGKKNTVLGISIISTYHQANVPKK